MTDSIKVFRNEALSDGRVGVALTDNPARGRWADTYGFEGCPWCRGRGCLKCDEARKEAERQMMQPIFSFDPNDPEDVELAKTCIHADVLAKAFAPGGGGTRHIEYLCAVASLKQAMRTMRRAPTRHAQ